MVENKERIFGSGTASDKEIKSKRGEFFVFLVNLAVMLLPERDMAAYRLNLCYTIHMTFGTGLRLRQLSPILKNEDMRHQMILRSVENNSVIEGLPRFTKTTRKECLEEIKKIAATH